MNGVKSGTYTFASENEASIVWRDNIRGMRLMKIMTESITALSSFSSSSHPRD